MALIQDRHEKTSRITDSRLSKARHWILPAQALKRLRNQQGSHANPLRSTFTLGGIDPSDWDGVGPKSMIVGVPTAAAIWLKPLSLRTMTPADAMTSAVSRCFAAKFHSIAEQTGFRTKENRQMVLTPSSAADRMTPREVR